MLINLGILHFVTHDLHRLISYSCLYLLFFPILLGFLNWAPEENTYGNWPTQYKYVINK